MAEVRKYNPDAGDGLGKLVRDALGENIRPHQPGGQKDDEGEQSQDSEVHPAEATASSLPIWPSDGPAYTF